MPRRKRHDPAESGPIDGDYNRLQVLDKQPGLDYVWADAEDLQRFKFEGYANVTRREGGERVFVDGATGESITVGGLTLLAAPMAVKKRRVARSNAAGADREAELRVNMRNKATIQDRGVTTSLG